MVARVHARTRPHDNLATEARDQGADRTRYTAMSTFGYHKQPNMAAPNFSNRTIWVRDNLHIMRGMNSETVDLIYVDPPFKSDVKYQGLPTDFGGDGVVKAEFKDRWKLRDEDRNWHTSSKGEHRCIYEVIEASKLAFGGDMMSCLIYMTARLFEMERILKRTGSIYLRCDYHANHYVKIIMDCIFGKKNFVNEIIWCYPSMSRAKKRFPRKNDTILFYAKSEEYIFNARDPLAREEYKESAKSRAKYGGAGFAGKKGKANYLRGDTKLADTVWSIPHVKGKESAKYPTQKPLKLLRRIIATSARKDDMVFDPFCGRATALVAAEDLERKWVGIDISPVARFLVKNRIESELGKQLKIGQRELIVARTDPPARTDVEKNRQETRSEMRQRLYTEQDEMRNGCFWKVPKHSMNDDCIAPKAKGGQDVADNIQLLCGTCNSIKGDRDMNYLHARLRELNYMNPEHA